MRAMTMTANNDNDKPLLTYRDAVVYPSDLALLDSPTAWLNDACINFCLTRLQHRRTTRNPDEGPPSPEKGGGGGAARGERKRRKRIGEEDDDGAGKEEGENRSEDLFVDPSVISFLMHQLTEGDDDYLEELSNLNAAWNLPRLPTTSGAQHDRRRRRKRAFVPVSDQFGASRSAFVRPGGGRHWSMLLWEIDMRRTIGDDGVRRSNASVGVSFRHFDSCRGCNASAARAVARKLVEVLRASSLGADGVLAENAAEVVECRAPQQRNGHDCGVFALGIAEVLSSLDEHGVSKERHEALLRSRFEGGGGDDGFAAGLRKQIGDDIRQLSERKR